MMNGLWSLPSRSSESDEGTALWKATVKYHVTGQQAGIHAEGNSKEFLSRTWCFCLPVPNCPQATSNTQHYNTESKSQRWCPSTSGYNPRQFTPEFYTHNFHYSHYSNFTHIYSGFIISTLFSISITQGNLHNKDAIYCNIVYESKMQLSTEIMDLPLMLLYIKQLITTNGNSVWP